MPEVNFNLLAPSADLYSGPQVKMDPVAAYEKAKATRQSNMLAELYAKHYDPQTGGVNYNALIGEAAQTGLSEAIPSIMGEAQKQAKSKADIAQTQALQRQQEAATREYEAKTKGVYDENRHKEVNRAISDISKYANKADAIAGIERNFEEGKLDQNAYDAVMGMVRAEPVWARSQSKILQSLLSEKEQLEVSKPTTEERTDGLYTWQVYSNPNLPNYGQEVPKSRIKQQLTAAQLEQKRQFDVTNERLAKAATGGGKTTVSQEQANYNVNRLLNAANQITSAMTAEEGVQKPGLKEAVVKGTFPSLAGAVQSGQRQIVDAAQTDMLDALLYLSTGAAYNKEQLEGQKKSYLPSFLDKPETVAAKQQRLITLIQDAKTRAGNAWTPDMDKKMDLILSSFKAAGTTQAKVSGKGTKDDPIKLD